jgi:hypothetical protein
MVNLDYELFSQLRGICCRANEQEFKALYSKDKEVFNSFKMSHFRDILYREYLIKLFWYGKNLYACSQGWFLISDWEYKINFLEKIIFDFDTNGIKLIWLENQLDFRLAMLTQCLDSYIPKAERMIKTNKELLIDEHPNFDNCSQEIKLIRKAMQLINYYHNPQPLPTDAILSPTMDAPEGAMMLSPNDKFIKNITGTKYLLYEIINDNQEIN